VQQNLKSDEKCTQEAYALIRLLVIV